MFNRLFLPLLGVALSILAGPAFAVDQATIDQVVMAHETHNDLVNGFAALINERHERHPGRSIPAGLLASISHHWRAAADGFRLNFVSNLRNTKGVICEIRVGYHGLIHKDWETAEPNIVIVFVALNVTRASAQITARVEHCFSLHALSRFYERSGCVEDCEVIGAMTKALVIDPKEYESGSDVSCDSWRGTIMHRTVGEDQIRLWSARTWWE